MTDLSGEALMNTAQAQDLGTLAHMVDLALDCHQEGTCKVLSLPAMFLSGKMCEQGLIRLLPALPAERGELLKVDDHLIDSAALRLAVRIFLRSAFDPVIIGTGKALVVWEEGLEGIVFFRNDADR